MEEITNLRTQALGMKSGLANMEEKIQVEFCASGKAGTIDGFCEKLPAIKNQTKQ